MRSECPRAALRGQPLPCWNRFGARGGCVPPSGTPLFFRGVGGAFGASLRVWNRRRGSREDQLTHRAEPVLTATPGPSERLLNDRQGDLVVGLRASADVAAAAAAATCRTVQLADDLAGLLDLV